MTQVLDERNVSMPFFELGILAYSLHSTSHLGHRELYPSLDLASCVGYMLKASAPASPPGS